MKKLLFALLVGVMGLAFSGCDKETEAAAMLEVTVMNRANQPLVDYPVILTKSLDKPFVVLKEGVTDKNGVCSFLFDAAELTSVDPVNKGTYTQVYFIILDPVTKEMLPSAYKQVIVQQGDTAKHSAWLEK